MDKQAYSDLARVFAFVGVIALALAAITLAFLANQ